MTFKDILNQAVSGAPLTSAQAVTAFNAIMSGEVSPVQIASFLTALRVRGETVDEIAGAAQVMREKAAKIAAPADAIDNCGTGGDSKGSLNISTASALVIAGAGVPVAKHGNRALSSKSGSSQVLEALGVNIDADMALIEQSIRDAGVGFMMATRHHGAMKHVGPVRVELGIRTIFNLLGPLSNPAGTKRQVIGVFAEQWVEPIAQVLRSLGSEAAWVVHGHDGMDELTTTTTSAVAALKDGKISTFTLNPADYGFAPASEADLAGGEPAENAAAITALLMGGPGAYRDIVLLNAGAALVVAGKAGDLAQGITLAANSIDSGAAKAALAKMVAISTS